jgi:hypothetical protein
MEQENGNSTRLKLQPRLSRTKGQVTAAAAQIKSGFTNYCTYCREKKVQSGRITRVENSGKSEEKRIEIDCNGDMRN